MAPLQRDLGDRTTVNANNLPQGAEHPTTPAPNDEPIEELDVAIIGAGFAGCYLLYQLRCRGFATKIVEAGSGLGGIWHWNTYPGARVDSQYPVYAYSLPEVYEDWVWKSDYADHVEMREYFQHVDKKLDISSGTIFETKVVEAEFDQASSKWTVICNTGKRLRATHLIACQGFAAKRYFPDWEGLDQFEGVIHHSSFWPKEGVDIKGKHCGVIGTGATGIQITQEWSREIDPSGSVKMFQRTPNMACAMKQRFLTKETQEEDKKNYKQTFKIRETTFNGFVFEARKELMFNATPEQNMEMFEKLWEMGGFRFLMNNYFDMTRDVKANRIAYDFWRSKVHARIKDARKAELVAPKEPPHPFGGKRVSLEQDLYDLLNKPNVDVIDVKTSPIVRFEKDGIRQADGTFHKLDVIALATGFDSITGGLKDMKITGLNGQILAEKWKLGTTAYLGMATAGFPNFWFTYGPLAPTAFSNGPSSIEIQADWLVDCFVSMREKGSTMINTQDNAEKWWRQHVNEESVKGLRGHTDSWYNGSNIPGKPKEALNYAGGIPLYLKTLNDVAQEGYKGFTLQQTQDQSIRYPRL